MHRYKTYLHKSKQKHKLWDWKREGMRQIKRKRGVSTSNQQRGGGEMGQRKMNLAGRSSM
jgi:hypothetical protein